MIVSGSDTTPAATVEPPKNERPPKKRSKGSPPRTRTLASMTIGSIVRVAQVQRGVGGSLMPGEMQRRVGCFDASAGTRYRLEVETLADLAAAEALQPRFVVAPSVALAREGLSLTSMVWLGALLTALTGGAMLLW